MGVGGAFAVLGVASPCVHSPPAGVKITPAFGNVCLTSGRIVAFEHAHQTRLSWRPAERHLWQSDPKEC